MAIRNAYFSAEAGYWDEKKLSTKIRKRHPYANNMDVSSVLRCIRRKNGENEIEE